MLAFAGEGKGTTVWDGDEAASIGIRITLRVFSMDPYSWATDSLGYCLQYASGAEEWEYDVFGFSMTRAGYILRRIFTITQSPSVLPS